MSRSLVLRSGSIETPKKEEKVDNHQNCRYYQTTVLLGGSMKRILAILLLAGCATKSAQPKPLTPLVTTGITQTTAVLAPKAEREQTFLSNLRTNYPYPIPYSEEDTVTFGWLWCQAYDDGMTTTDISDRIELGSNTQQEMDLQKAIVTNAFLDLCPA